MSMENLGPYSNFHELNQDWFLNEFNKLLEQWKAMQKNFDNLKDAFNDLKSYVMDYFKNLDVQEEINNKLNSMIADGTLLNIISPTISNVTGNWLSEHITNPTNPPIDNSLTVSNAAADSKVVGDKLNDINNDLKNYAKSDFRFVPNTENNKFCRWDDGRIVSYEGKSVSSRIPVEELENVEIYSNNDIYAICFFNGETFVSGSNTLQKSFSIPANCNNVIISFNGLDTNISIVYTSKIDDYIVNTQVFTRI